MSIRTSALLLASLLITACGRLPSEGSLRSQFMQHREALEQLRRMQAEDSKVIRIAPTFTRLENDWNWPRENIGITNQRWDEYKALFARARIPDGIQNDDGYLFFFAASQGLGISGNSRGFVYTPERPKQVVQHLNECRYTKESEICFIQLEGNWFLFEWPT